MRVALAVGATIVVGTGALAPVPLPASTVPTPPEPPPAVVEVPEADFRWPLRGMPAVVRPFEAPAHTYGPGHRGVDLAALPGAEVLAVADGTVVFAGQVAGHGVVSVDHANGLRSTYEPVTPTVAAGQVVRTGDVLGLLEPGHPGCAAVACLHWGVRRGRDYLDPLQLIAPTRIRLLPWSGIS